MAPTHVIEFDEAELIVRMIEAHSGIIRPSGCSAEAALAALDPDVRHGWMRVMATIRAYWDEVAFEKRRIQ